MSVLTTVSDTLKTVSLLGRSKKDMLNRFIESKKSHMDIVFKRNDPGWIHYLLDGDDLSLILMDILRFDTSYSVNDIIGELYSLSTKRPRTIAEGRLIQNVIESKLRSDPFFPKEYKEQYDIARKIALRAKKEFTFDHDGRTRLIKCINKLILCQQLTVDIRLASDEKLDIANTKLKRLLAAVARK